MVICGTGHRPSKLYDGYSNETIEKLINVAQEKLVELEPDITINGGALGWDTAFAIASIRLGIPTKSYIPFIGQEKKWPEKSRKIYNRILEKSLEVKIICVGEYCPSKMQTRNEAMVNDSDLILALWDGSSGGTKNCIDYANKLKKPVENCWDLYLENLKK